MLFRSDGLGNIRKEPNRIDFDPFPYHSFAVWILTQMKRWGYIKGDANYAQIAEQVFLLTDAKKQMLHAGWKPPNGVYRKYSIMGKMFDPTRPAEYVKSFAIQRS